MLSTNIQVQVSDGSLFDQSSRVRIRKQHKERPFAPPNAKIGWGPLACTLSR